jgi:glycosyltransferase involved in cell wall biosynthesis
LSKHCATPSSTNSAAEAPRPQCPRAVFVYNTAQYLLRFRSELIRECQQRGFECHAALPQQVPAEEAQALEDMGVIVHTLDRFVDQRITPLADLQLLRQYYVLYRRLRPAVVFNFTIKPCLYSGLAARMAGVPRIAATITGLGYAFSDDSARGRVMAWAAGLAYRIALQGNTTVFFQNTEDRAFFERRRIVKAGRSVLVEGSGVNTLAFKPGPHLGKAPVFLMVARLLKTKGVIEYLEAARLTKRRQPEARFVLVGAFDHNPAGIAPEVLERYINEGIIEYRGYLADPRTAYHSASVYVLPSYAEGRPRTVLEAMACGLAILTTDARGCREAIEPGVNGYLVPVKSAEALSERMIQLCREPDRVREMGLASRRIAEERYDVAHVTKTIWDALQRAV